MEVLLKTLYLVILMRCSSCWLLPHDTKRNGNAQTERKVARLPLASSQLSNVCATITGCLNEMKSLSQNTNRLGFTLLGPGLSRLVVSSKLQNTVTDDSGNFYPYTSHLIELYSATDGVHYTDNQHSLQELWMFPNYFLLSLEEAVEIYQDFPMDTLRNPSLYPDTEEYASLDLNEFHGSHFPIMASGMGDYIFLDLSNGRVFEYVPTFNEAENEQDEGQLNNFSGILVFLRQILHRFKHGRYHTVNGVAIEREDNMAQADVTENVIGASEGNNEIENDDYDVSGDSPRRSPKAAQRLHNRHGMPLLHLNCRGMGMICNFFEHSINEHGSQRTLCKIKRNTNIKTNNRKMCGSTKRVRGSDCNQFPFESTRHSSALASERRASLVPTVELNVLGGQIRAFYRATEISTRPKKRCFKVASP